MNDTDVNFKSNNNVSPDMFKSSFLNFLTRTHISLPLIIFYGSSAYLLFFPKSAVPLTAMHTLGLFCLGLLIFTFVEYNIHRFIYHPVGNLNWAKKIAYSVHGIHHDYPKDKMRLALPPWLSVLIAYLIVVLFEKVAPNQAQPLASGFLFGYATYLVVHYAVHIFPTPRNFLGVLWKNHNLHHYKYKDKLYGVSSPLWDYVYRTHAPKKKT
ncbi:MAG TPA: sterol desaturase family protein [Oligoflexia bacterium]|nr:sterol desaturase family protein [Oligoflexia bacterium]HMR23764.1 sterol desaturase family protein [Oligoflexia bacterium]